LVGVDLRLNIKKHAFKRDWTMCSNYVNYSRLNGNHEFGGGDLHDHLMSTRALTSILNKIII
jgi:hypothetical protein